VPKVNPPKPNLDDNKFGNRKGRSTTHTIISVLHTTGYTKSRPQHRTTEQTIGPHVATGISSSMLLVYAWFKANSNNQFLPFVRKDSY